MRSSPSPRKSPILRVASEQPLVAAMPAICRSASFKGIWWSGKPPALANPNRLAAMRTAPSSKGRTRVPKRPMAMLTAVCSLSRLLPEGSNWTPTDNSRAVTVDIAQMSKWASSHATTADAGEGRKPSETTFVSSRITLIYSKSIERSGALRIFSKVRVKSAPGRLMLTSHDPNPG